MVLAFRQDFRLLTQLSTRLFIQKSSTSRSAAEAEQHILYKRSRLLFAQNTLPIGIRNVKDANLVAARLLSVERKLLYDALRKSMADDYLERKRLSTNATVQSDDLVQLWYVYLIPSFAFGALDSVLLIVLAESINWSVAGFIGLSAMGAAAISNIICNVSLTAFQQFIEVLLGEVGIKRPLLSIEQLQHTWVKIVSTAGKVLGMLGGSVLGMIPFFFIKGELTDDRHIEEPQTILDVCH